MKAPDSYYSSDDLKKAAVFIKKILKGEKGTVELFGTAPGTGMLVQIALIKKAYAENTNNFRGVVQNSIKDASGGFSRAASVDCNGL